MANESHPPSSWSQIRWFTFEAPGPRSFDPPLTRVVNLGEHLMLFRGQRLQLFSLHSFICITYNTYNIIIDMFFFLSQTSICNKKVCFYKYAREKGEESNFTFRIALAFMNILFKYCIFCFSLDLVRMDGLVVFRWRFGPFSANSAEFGDGENFPLFFVQKVQISKTTDNQGFCNIPTQKHIQRSAICYFGDVTNSISNSKVRLIVLTTRVKTA